MNSLEHVQHPTYIKQQYRPNEALREAIGETLYGSEYQKSASSASFLFVSLRSWAMHSSDYDNQQSEAWRKLQEANRSFSELNISLPVSGFAFLIPKQEKTPVMLVRANPETLRPGEKRDISAMTGILHQSFMPVLNTDRTSASPLRDIAKSTQVKTREVYKHPIRVDSSQREYPVASIAARILNARIKKSFEEKGGDALYRIHPNQLTVR